MHGQASAGEPRIPRTRIGPRPGRTIPPVDTIGSARGRGMNASDTPVVLRDTERPGPASVLIEANDRLQELRALLAGAMHAAEPPRGTEPTTDT